MTRIEEAIWAAAFGAQAAREDELYEVETGLGKAQAATCCDAGDWAVDAYRSLVVRGLVGAGDREKHHAYCSCGDCESAR